MERGAVRAVKRNNRAETDVNREDGTWTRRRDTDLETRDISLE